MNEILIIYADVLFLINFILDFLCLYVTGAILSEKIGLWKLVFASAFGGMYSLLSPYISCEGVYISLPIGIAAAVFMVMLAFGFKMPKRIFLRTFVFVLSSAFAGGILSAVFSLSGKYYIHDGGFYAEISPVFLTAVAFLSVLCAYIYGVLCRKALSVSSVEAEFTVNGITYAVRLLVDTGCHIIDPVTGEMTVIVASDKMKNVVSSRLIPVNTAGGSQLFSCLTPEKAVINGREVACTLALDSQNTAFNGCDGLIPKELL